MKYISTTAAKNSFKEIVDSISASGESVIVERNNKPVAIISKADPSLIYPSKRGRKMVEKIKRRNERLDRRRVKPILTDKEYKEAVKAMKEFRESL